MSEATTRVLDLDSVVSWSTKQLSGSSPRGIVVLDVANGRHFGFDATGERIWQSLRNPTSLGALVEELSRAYDGDSSEIAEEVIGFVGKLVNQGLLVVR
jgi:hypothetical protein